MSNTRILKFITVFLLLCVLLASLGCGKQKDNTAELKPVKTYEQTKTKLSDMSDDDLSKFFTSSGLTVPEGTFANEEQNKKAIRYFVTQFEDDPSWIQVSGMAEYTIVNLRVKIIAAQYYNNNEALLEAQKMLSEMVK